MILALLQLAYGACDAYSLGASMRDAEDAFAEMSPDFERLRSDIQQNVDCLEVVIDPKAAARLHYTRGLFFFFDEDDAATRRSFSRYRSLDADAELPDRIAPRDHPLHELFDDILGPVYKELPPAKSGALYIDGERKDEAPKNLPFLLQHVGPDGRVLSGGLVDPNDPLPAYPGSDEAKSSPLSGTGRKLSDGLAKMKSPEPLALAGIAVLGVGVVAYVAAFAPKGAYKRAVDAGDRDLIVRNHALANGIGITGLVLMGTGTGLVVTGTFR